MYQEMNSDLLQQERQLQAELLVVFPTHMPHSFQKASSPHTLFNMVTPWDKIAAIENDIRLAEEFDQLSDTERLYYLPGYLSAALDDPYHQRHLFDILVSDSKILNSLSMGQLDWVSRFIKLLRLQILNLVGIERWCTEISLHDLDKAEKLLKNLL